MADCTPLDYCDKGDGRAFYLSKFSESLSLSPSLFLSECVCACVCVCVLWCACCFVCVFVCVCVCVCHSVYQMWHRSGVKCVGSQVIEGHSPADATPKMADQRAILQLMQHQRWLTRGPFYS